jgi:sugar phosphate isomerase/epimerase
MLLSRRSVMLSALGACELPGAGRKFRIGVTDWNLRLAGKVEAVSTAARMGFEGVEVSLGRTPTGDKLPLDDAATIASYRAAAKQHKIRLAGTCLDVLHPKPLKSEKISAKYVADAIRITKALEARVVLLPFFGPGSPETEAEQNYVADVLKELAPEAEKARVTLGLEDQLSARANVRMMERAKSPAVLVYYDVGNSTHWHHDVLEELKWLGAGRICQMHFKEDGPARLGEGKMPFPEIVRAVEEIGFREFVNLETYSRTEKPDEFMPRDLAYIRKLRG